MFAFPLLRCCGFFQFPMVREKYQTFVVQSRMSETEFFQMFYKSLVFRRKHLVCCWVPCNPSLRFSRHSLDSKLNGVSYSDARLLGLPCPCC